MRDFLPSDVRKRNYVIGIIKEVYESYGFEPLETPAVENIETLMGKYGDEGNQLIFKILKRGEKLDESLEARDKRQDVNDSGSSLQSPVSSLADLALRYDLTVPLARVVANNKNELPKFFKRYQIQPVWRADRPARGRFREFYQCDVDAIGSTSMVVEAELISAVSEIMTRLGFEDFVIRINHRTILLALLESVNIPISKHADTLVALDKIDKIGRKGVEEEFQRQNIDEAAGSKILDLLERLANRTKIAEKGLEETQQSIDFPMPGAGLLYSNNLEDVKLFIYQSLEGHRAIKALYELYKLAVATGHESRLRMDPSLARGLSYYTGAIMEINVPDLAGSLGGGGRYDGLIGMFGKEHIPACGFSLGLERILVVMEERNMFPPEIAASNSADVMVTIWNEETIGESLKLANELRAAGLRVTVYPEADKLGKQLKYADSIKVPYVCVLGESELAENKVTLKNMASGEQKIMTRDKIAEEIKSPTV